MRSGDLQALWKNYGKQGLDRCGHFSHIVLFFACFLLPHPLDFIPLDFSRYVSSNFVEIYNTNTFRAENSIILWLIITKCADKMYISSDILFIKYTSWGGVYHHCFCVHRTQKNTALSNRTAFQLFFSLCQFFQHQFFDAHRVWLTTKQLHAMTHHHDHTRHSFFNFFHQSAIGDHHD